MPLRKTIRAPAGTTKPHSRLELADHVHDRQDWRRTIRSIGAATSLLVAGTHGRHHQEDTKEKTIRTEGRTRGGSRTRRSGAKAKSASAQRNGRCRSGAKEESVSAHRYGRGRSGAREESVSAHRNRRGRSGEKAKSVSAHRNGKGRAARPRELRVTLRGRGGRRTVPHSQLISESSLWTTCRHPVHVWNR